MSNPLYLHIFLLFYSLLIRPDFIDTFSRTALSSQVIKVQPSNGTVLIQATPGGALPDQLVGYCQTGQSSVTFTNLGMANDPALSIVTDLSMGIGLGTGFEMQNGGFEISSLQIAGVTIPNLSVMNSIADHPLFLNDPDGPGGLTDADGDGFFDDLELGNSVVVTAQYIFACDQASSDDFTTNCTNDFSTALNARLEYLENGQTQSSELNDYFRPANMSFSSNYYTDPDAFAGVDTFRISQSISRQIRFFDTNCSDAGQFLVNIAMPNGVSAITNQFKLIKNGSDPVPLIDIQQNGVALNLMYDASFSNFLSGEYSLEMVFTSNCFVALGESTFPIQLEHFCPACDCGHIWYCDELAGPHFHVTSPPCPGELLLDCTAGLQARQFEVNRTSIGFSDVGFSVPFDPGLADQKVALPCDKVSMQFISTVGEMSIADSVGILVNYSNPDGSSSPEELFLFSNGNLRLTHEGNEINCQVTADQLSFINAGTDKSILIDLNDCVSNLGFSLDEGDSLELIMDLTINPDGPIPSEFFIIPNLRAVAFATIEGNRQSCDSYGDAFRVGRTKAIYDYPTSLQGMPRGCEAGELHFRLFVPENDFANYFGNELREAQKIDSFVFDFDPGLLDIYPDAKVKVSIPGHPIHGGDYFNIQPLSEFVNGHYLAVFDTLSFVPSLNNIEEYSFDLKVVLPPNCLAGTNNPFNLNSQIYYRERFYARSFNADCAAPQNESGTSEIQYSDPYDLALAISSSPTVSSQGGTAEWVLTVCNNSANAVAEVVWLSVEDTSGILSLNSIANINDANNPEILTLAPYGLNNQFSFIPALTPGECMDLLLSANVSNCRSIDFRIGAGWNCQLADPLSWTPENNLCEEDSLTLSVSNSNASPINLDVVSVVGSCLNGGEELVEVEGVLSSVIDIAGDNFTISFMVDENGDGLIQPGEQILTQENISGALGSGTFLPFNTSFTVGATNLCNLLVILEADNTDLCTGVLEPLPLPQLNNAGTDQFICSLNGSTLMTSLGTDLCTSNGYSFFWSAEAPADVTHLTDPFNAVTEVSLDANSFLGETLTYMLETQRNGCQGSVYDTVQIHLPESTDGFFQNDSLWIQAANCQSLTSFCLGIDLNQLSDFGVTVNNVLLSTPDFVSCNGNEAAVQLPPGLHLVTVEDLSNNCADSLVLNIICTETQSLDMVLGLNQSDTVCLSSDELSGMIVLLENFCEDGSVVDYEILNDTCIVLTGILAGEEQACFVACDANNFCDTTFLNINVLHPFPNGIADTIVISQIEEFCFDDQLVNIIGPIETFENICPGQSGDEVAFNLDPINQCLFYDGLSIGSDAACIRLCDSVGNCDTINFLVEVVPGNTVTDTVFITVDTNSFCVDGSLLPGDIVSIDDLCPANNGTQAIFEIEGACVNYYGAAIGQDTMCLRVEDEFGNVALVNLIVTVVRTTPETFCDSIFVGEVDQFCLDTFELPGIYQDFEIIFDGNDPENVSFDENLVNFCVRYEGLQEGQDSFAIALCDNFGFCDTTTLCISVAPYFDPPGLTADTSSTLKETPVVLDPLANDTVFGGIQSYFILFPPISGNVEINFDGSITYEPDPPFCARWDEFTYVVCNPIGCDTTTVSIFIECVELTIFNAVSPNNDDVNDYFYIAKIENFPNNRLWIYNRWGNQVFDSGSEGYKNNWPGTWGDDIDLPDGTYYYILEWSDNGNTTVQRGYFEMFR